LKKNRLFYTDNSMQTLPVTSSVAKTGEWIGGLLSGKWQ